MVVIVALAFLWRYYRHDNKQSSDISPKQKVIKVVWPADDTDLDGLKDDEEKALGTDPNNVDSDRDGLMDGDEAHKYHTDPKSADTDQDGVGDLIEIRFGKNPLSPNKK